MNRLGEYAGGVQLAYENQIAAADPTLAQTIESARSFDEDWTSAALRVLNTYTLADSQRRLLNAQMDRANRGLPPLNSSQYGLGVNVGLSPETMRLVGFGLAGVALLLFLAKRRR